MTKGLDQITGVTVLNDEIVAKFAMAEELRLVSSKMDRLYKELQAKIILPEEAEYHFQKLARAITDVENTKKELKRKNKCQTKKNTKCANQKKTCTGSITVRKNSWNVLSKLKSFWAKF